MEPKHVLQAIALLKKVQMFLEVCRCTEYYPVKKICATGLVEQVFNSMFVIHVMVSMNKWLVSSWWNHDVVSYLSGIYTHEFAVN